MGFGDIIKKAWHITWRYKALWVLGIFAGISGCQSSFGSSSRYGTSSGRTTSTSAANPFGELTPARLHNLLADVRSIIVLVTVLLVGLLAVWFVWWLLGIAARGGLVHAVNEIEENRPVRLGELWNRGFNKWGSVFVLELLLKVPLTLAALAMVGAIFVPVIRFAATASNGGSTNPAQMLVPICGVLGIGLPLLAAMSFFFGILYLTALRRVVLDNEAPADSIARAWADLRARFKDHFLMYLFNWLLNTAASIVISIPIVIVTLIVLIPAAIPLASGNARPFVAAFAVLLALSIPIGLIYSAIWGTYTSALWTIFYRRLVGREIVAEQVVPTYTPQPPMPGAQSPYQPQTSVPQPPSYAPQPPVYQPPAPPAPVAPPAAPPVAPVTPPVIEPPAPAEPQYPTTPPAPAEPAYPTTPPAPPAPPVEPPL